MRRVLIDAQNVTVAGGGLLHTGDGIVPGVAEEVALAEQKGIPRFLSEASADHEKARGRTAAGEVAKRAVGRSKPQSSLAQTMSPPASMSCLSTWGIGAQPRTRLQPYQMESDAPKAISRSSGRYDRCGVNGLYPPRNRGIRLAS